MEKELLTRLYGVGPLCIVAWLPLAGDEHDVAEKLASRQLAERKRNLARITTKGAVYVQDQGWRPRDEAAELAALARIAEAGGALGGYVRAEPDPKSFIFCVLLLQERGETKVTGVSSDLVYVSRIELTAAGKARLASLQTYR